MSSSMLAFISCLMMASMPCTSMRLKVQEPLVSAQESLAALNQSENNSKWWGYPEWVARYAGCDTFCGTGTDKVTLVVCMKSGKVVADGECDSETIPKDKECVENIGCEWRLGGLPEGNCGYAREAQCWARNGVSAVDSKHCSAILAQSADDFLMSEGRILKGCKGDELKHLCLATMHDIYGMESANEKGLTLTQSLSCGSADVIVIATQGMTLTKHYSLWTVFESFGNDFAPYVPVSRCGGDISAGVVVLAHESKQQLFSPLHGKCITEDNAGNAFLTPGLFRSMLGSVVNEVHTIQGTLVAVSTHGPNGGTVSSDRVAGFADTVHHILELSPKFVAWGGDFNMRMLLPDANATDELLKLGATHPPVNSSDVDQKPEWRSLFDPEAAHAALKEIPDVLGNESQSLSDELLVFSNSTLVEVGGIKELCPTYSKAPKPFRNTWKSWFGRHTWLANFACQSPSGSIEYFRSPLDGKTKWSRDDQSEAPSWPDRLIVDQGATKCGTPSKVKATKGHDTVFALCTLA